MPQVNFRLAQREVDLLDDLTARKGFESRTDTVRRLLGLGRNHWGLHDEELEKLIAAHGEKAPLEVTVVDLQAGDEAAATIDGEPVDDLRVDAAATHDGHLDLYLAPSWTQRIWIAQVPAADGVTVSLPLALLRNLRDDRL